MDMNSIVELVLFIIGFFIAKHLEKKLPDAVKKDVIEKPIEKPSINIYVEKIRDMYYAWEENKKFLFQHTDADEMAKMLIRKYPNNTVKIEEKVIA